MEGRGFRDRAPQFAEAGIEILGISFDPPEENRRFAEQNGFPFRLLSDRDRSAGERYETKRGPEESSPESKETAEVAEKAEEIKDEIDDLLDEIDEVLEQNAEEFVRSYVQKGGE